MAFTKDQREPNVPISNVDNRETSDLLPRYYRTTSNKKFLQGTLDQLTQPGTVKKISGYLGRTNAKAVSSKDIFLAASDADRQAYQLEPAAVIKDYLGNTTFFKDYIDHMNHIEVFDGITTNHSRVNKQEFYSWNPHICWDKFTNFQQYYWLPFGPDPIEIFGQSLDIISEYTVRTVDEGDNAAYLFDPKGPTDGLVRNPVLRLFRGQTYVFDVDSLGHPFSIKTSRVSDSIDRYTLGISGNAIETGKLTFTVPENAPDVLFYVSENAVDTGGIFQILDITENTEINITSDLIGKKTYIIPNGTAAGLKISNGMKLSFGGNVTPNEYRDGFWYIDGVGTGIKLISEASLEIRSTYTQEQSLLFDDIPFDQMPFSETGTFPSKKDYISINRASIDSNPWSRYNRWFHKDVIEVSATANGNIAEFNQTARATRPIIEFKSDIKLHNYGIISKKSVDVIDNYTTDVFSTVEGSTGYNVDGIDLANGMRVLFNADTDSMVRGKIFKVNFIEVAIPTSQLSFDAATDIRTDTSTIVFPVEHGLNSGNQVTYLENGNTTISELVHRQIYYVKAINQFTIALYKNKELTSQVYIYNTGIGKYLFELFIGYRRQIQLTEELDATPVRYESVSIRFGTNDLVGGLTGNQGQNYWYTGTTWSLSQLKLTVNQPPLFDIFDSNGYSYSDITIYNGSNFNGNKIFSYKVGTSIPDSELGFPLTYKNIDNVGDIVFDFNLLNSSVAYNTGLTVSYKNTDIGYLKCSRSLHAYQFENGWTLNKIENSQPIIRVFKNIDPFPMQDIADQETYATADGVIYTFNKALGVGVWKTDTFPIDVFADKDNLDDLEIRVYINGTRVNKQYLNSENIYTAAYEVLDGVVKKFVRLLSVSAKETDVVSLKCFSKQIKNGNGYYELPINLQNNPLNDNISEFTLGEVVDHVSTIIDNINTFQGSYPGNSNMRDIGNVSEFGTRFVQHSGPLNLALYHLGSKSANLIKALTKARNEYGQFKRSFLVAANNSGIDLDAKRHVDYILQEMNKDKPISNPYYLSDMFGYTAVNKLEINVLDSRIKVYPLTDRFTLTTLSNKAVNVYLNERQLVYGRDYTFGDTEFFTVLTDLVENDILEIYEYETTDGCFCPPTPTKLGIFPKFEPKRYIDNSYIEPTEVIQGHDGSITIAFGDYRDELILELETRIFNNIKVSYDPSIFDIYNFIPGNDRITAYTLEEFDKVLSKYFFQWTLNISEDYTKHTSYDHANSFTFNYRNSTTPDSKPLVASWRGIYKQLLDTDVPHIKPWECLGFSIEPTWWQDIYGPAPYTSDNLILWADIKSGIIRAPGVPVRRDPKFAKSIIAYGLPVDENGDLLSPLDAGFVTNFINYGDSGYFAFGDQAAVESAWRRSSYYAFAVLETCLLLSPNDVLARCIDRSRVVKNLDNQLVYADTNLRIRLADIAVPSVARSNSGPRISTCGLINYVVDYLTSENTAKLDEYTSNLGSLTNNISTRLGGFTSKPKYKLLLDSKSPNSSGGVFIPEENYSVELNISSAIKKVVYSGMIITKHADGFEVKGYTIDNPYFEYFSFKADDRVVRVGGISESYLLWNPGKTYVAGKVILADDMYYRVKITHVSGETFNNTYYARLPALPIVGGHSAIIKKYCDKSTINRIAYGTRLSTIQDVAELLQGYGAYLEDCGFVFNDFNNAVSDISNWETSLKEFLFWASQGWADGAAISLSPVANKVVFKSNASVVDSLIDPFYNYNVYKVDGTKLDSEFITVYRSGNEFVIEPNNTVQGIYGLTLYLVQKEHIVILDDTTLFNDTIYSKSTGYRQERIKALGYITTNWNGGFEIPGFIYDTALVNSWDSWTDYNLGDIVKYKEFYYSAKKFLPGVETFENSNWVLLDGKPKSELLPNWDYRAEQFTDFYDLDTDNFDSEQQRMAQHLIGYQKRQYLENIINNDVSQYKFYQGMIAEKGTLNVLSKLFDVLSADNQESLTFDEEWAFRVGEYGAIDTFEEVEFILDDSMFKTQPQPLELVDYVDTTAVDYVYRQRPSDVYIKPSNVTKDIWAKKQTTDYLRTPGYVRKDNVKLNIDTLSDLTNVDISTFKEGDYVWTAFESTGWNVYRFSLSEYKIINAVYTSDHTLTLLLDKPVHYSIGTVIGIENSTLKGFHVVTGVSLNKLTFTVLLTGFTEFTDANTVLFYVMTSQRVATVDNIDLIVTNRLKKNELVWADNNGNNKWTVYKNLPVYSRDTLLNATPTTDLKFGSSIALTANGNCAAVADSDNITIYIKGSSDNNWSAIQRIPRVDSNSIVTQFSKDGAWLAISNPTNNSNNGYVAIYKRNSNRLYDFQSKIDGQAAENLGSNIAIATSGNNNYKLVVSSTLGITVYNASGLIQNIQNAFQNSEFGYDIALSDSGQLVISAPGYNTGTVYVYGLINDAFGPPTILPKIVKNADARFGETVAISESGKYIAVGSPLTNTGLTFDAGRVYIYELINNQYVIIQEITSIYNEVNERFGSIVEFINDGNSLAIFSLNSDKTDIYELTDNTTFDNGTLRIIDKLDDIGRVDIYDRYNTKFVYGETLQQVSTKFTGYGKQLAVGGNTILISAVNATNAGYINSGITYSYIKAPITASWMPLHVQSYRVDISTIKKAFLYNKLTNQIVKYLDVVDPTVGKIPGLADQEIKFKTYFDPATYSVGTDAVAVDDGMSWTTDQIGMLWWDLSRAKFLDTESGGVVYKTSAWNRLYDTASIDIYEWVESTLLPNAWNEQVGTTNGATLNITGHTKYDNTVYSVKRRYDNVSQTFKNTYYFWVNNKLTIPAVEGRLLSANDVSKLISDPQSYGYSCLAFTDSNSVSLVNIDKYLENKNVILSIQYWTSPTRTSNYHSQWKLLSTNKNTVIPEQLERKWFHSLIGKDNLDRTLPDVSLPEKYRYGIEFKPRQSMFINRIEALKQYFERVNASIASILLVDDYDLSDLQKFEPIPSSVTGKWDLVKDTDTELRLISTSDFRLPKLAPIVNDNGEIVGITIIESGHGYIGKRPYNPNNNAVITTWYGPEISILGVGRYAELKTIINSSGSVVGVDVGNTGEGYDHSTTLTIRGFTVLTLSDTDTSGWALYSWNSDISEWQRVKTQSYNVNNYWEYVDWYVTGYTQYTKIDYLIDSTYELVTTEIPLNSIVKIKNIGSGGWVLLEKYDSAETIDYTINFRVIGRQNGTVKFLPTIYNPNTGFDKTLSDSTGYDINPVEELRIILNTIKTKILVDELHVEYLKLFFASVRYAMYEQVFIDWAFKTSFVKAMHNVGALKQKVTYNNDNLEFFEEYIKEVKPYRTKVREYVSNYNTIDYSSTSVTDFDLLPVIDNNFKVAPLTAYVTDNGEISSSFSELLTDPWNHWVDVLGFKITSIVISDQGENYITRPSVKIEGIQLGNGAPAVAKAYIAHGKVNRIDLITGGTKWAKAPIITLVGGLAVGGKNAKAVAIIGNSPIKTTYIKVKFDRISKVYQITDLKANEEFASYTLVSGSRTQFPLRWSPNIERDTYSVIMNGAEVLKNEYFLKTITSTSDGYTKYTGELVFAEPPVSGSVITVSYHKNFDHLEAVDRINFYYNPLTGQTGKDLSQLMTGIDYGGVMITGTNFGSTYGWQNSPWDATGTQHFEDATFEVTTDNKFKLPYVPEVGQVLNIYLSKFANNMYTDAIRIDDINYLTVNQTNTNAVMTSFIGDGEIDIVTIPETALDIGNKVIIRKIESDGSTPILDVDFDTKLTGGDLAYSSAVGVSPDDVILDGDSFGSSISSHAPEEVVPGHVTDTLAIKVYSRPTGGCPNILFKNYVGDSETRSFSIGQYFPNSNSVIVKVDNAVLDLDIDYIIEYETNAITFASPPAFGSDVSILSISFNSANILDVDYFIADGEATDYITKALWLPTISVTVLVNGEALAFSFFNTTNTGYSDVNGLPLINILGIRFASPPANGSIINYIIDNSDTKQTASIIKSETFTYNSEISNYELVNPVGISLPLEANVLVKANGVILVPPSYSYFTVEGARLIYGLADDKYQNTLISATNILVYVNGKLKTVGLDYNVLFNTEEAVAIELTPETYAEGKGSMLVVGTTITTDYMLDSSNSIRFTKPLAEGSNIEIISFYNHNILGIERLVNQFSQVISLTPGTPSYYEFTYNLGGIFTLPDTALSGDFVWVIKNGELLINRIDYYLESDFKTIRLIKTLKITDIVQLIAFTNTVVTDNFGFMQFKDMMNRTHYKRLNKAKATTLTQGLQQFDAEIHVTDSSILDLPNTARNIPGIIEIGGERIEYFVKGNNTLSQLRRATLGTGAPIMHFAGTTVQGLGASETIPYKDEFIIEMGDKKDDTGNLVYTELYTLGKMQFDFEVTANTIEVFVGGVRLKKSEYSLYANTAYPYSPEGDIVNPAEFSVTGNILQLTTLPIDPSFGTHLRVVVIKKQGTLWNTIGSRLVNSNNSVANFVKAAETVWPYAVFTG